MNKELLISKRKKAKELHEIGWSNREIARQLLASKNSVCKWVRMDERDVLIDNRGWEKGASRKYAPETQVSHPKIKNCHRTAACLQNFGSVLIFVTRHSFSSSMYPTDGGFRWCIEIMQNRHQAQ